MFELRDQNSNLSIVYDAVCKEVMCIVLHHDVTQSFGLGNNLTVHCDILVTSGPHRCPYIVT